jgi:hypothetical protein
LLGTVVVVVIVEAAVVMVAVTVLGGGRTYYISSASCYIKFARQNLEILLCCHACNYRFMNNISYRFVCMLVFNQICMPSSIGLLVITIKLETKII